MIGFTMVYHTKHHMAFSKNRDFFSVHSMPWFPSNVNLPISGQSSHVPQCKKKAMHTQTMNKRGNVVDQNLTFIILCLWSIFKKIKTCRKKTLVSIYRIIHRPFWCQTCLPPDPPDPPEPAWRPHRPMAVRRTRLELSGEAGSQLLARRL